MNKKNVCLSFLLLVVVRFVFVGGKTEEQGKKLTICRLVLSRVLCYNSKQYIGGSASINRTILTEDKALVMNKMVAAITKKIIS